MTATVESVRSDSRTRDKSQKEKIDWRGKNFFQLTFNQMYEDSAGSAIVLTTAGTYYAWATSTVGEESGVGYVVGDASNDTITIGASGGGVYLVTLAATFRGSNTATIYGSVFVNGVRQGNIAFGKKLASAELQCGMAVGLLELVEGDIITVRFTSDTNATTLTVEQVQLVAVRVSG